MRAPIVSATFARWLIVGSLVASAGCGGGTTGTSPTGAFQLVGVARSTAGTPLSDTDMTVSSANDSAPIGAARTDEQGRFGMALPATTTSLTVTINKKSSSLVPRSLSGSAILSTELVETSTDSVILRQPFEVQVNESTLCSALRLDGNILYRHGEVPPDDSCIVPFTLASSTLSPSRFRATISDGCGVTRQTTVRADGAGALAINVAPFVIRGCESFSIVVSHDDADQPGARFSVVG